MSNILHILSIYVASLPPDCQLHNFHRREIFESMLRGLGTRSIIRAMDVLLEHLGSLAVEEQAPVAVLLLQLDALVCSF
jgi:hypothetical protein